MPVGFVNVLESKEMLFDTNIPFVAIEGRRGGSPLAVASLRAQPRTADGADRRYFPCHEFCHGAGLWSA